MTPSCPSARGRAINKYQVVQIDAAKRTAQNSQALDNQGEYVVELETKRFLLRDFTDTDTAAFEAYHSDPRFQEFYGPEETKPDHARQLISLFKAWATAQPRLNYQLAIIQRSGARVLVGCGGLRCADAEPGSAELGIELAPEYWGRHAYAIEVIRSLVGYGFDTLGLCVIFGRTVDSNSRIGRLARAFGATAITQPTPIWMSSRGWTQIEWRITKQHWENGHLTITGKRRQKAARLL